MNAPTSRPPPPNLPIKRPGHTDDDQLDDSDIPLTGHRPKKARTKSATPPERAPTTSSDKDESASSFVATDDSDPDPHTDRTTSDALLEKRRHTTRLSSPPSDELQEMEQDTGMAVDSEIGEVGKIVTRNIWLLENTLDNDDK
ncbi:MAG: hypothetical protein Q9204_000052, partial [Flavoplaca sp. TL-2023a]